MKIPLTTTSSSFIPFVNPEMWSSCLQTSCWTTLLLCLGVCMLALYVPAMYYSFSVFFVELVTAFQESRSKTGWVYSINSAVFMFTGPLSGLILPRLGLRVTLFLGSVLAALGYLGSAFAQSLIHVFFFYSVVNGMGSSLTFSGWVVGLTRFWMRRYFLAVGVAMAGSGCGLLLLGPQIQMLVVQYGWRGAMVLCAGLYLQLCVLATTLHNQVQVVTSCPAHASCRGEDTALEQLLSHKDKAAGVKTQLEETCVKVKVMRVKGKVKDARYGSSSSRKVILSPAFCLVAWSCFLSMMATTVVFAVLRDWAEVAGLGVAFPSALASTGGGDLLGRLLAGILAGRCLSPLLLMAAVQLLLATTIGIAASAATSMQLVAAMVGFGVACGLHSVTFALIPAHFTARTDVSHVLGCLLFVTGLGQLMGPPLVGASVDFFHSYTIAMALCTALPVAAATLSIAAYCCFDHQAAAAAGR